MSTIKNLLAAATLGVVATGAPAAMVTLGGANFDVVYDDSQAGLAFFGSPTLAGDFLVFTPTNFKAASLNGSLLSLAAHSINVRFHIHGGYQATSIGMLEAGDYIKHGSQSAVGVGGRTRTLDLAQGASSEITQPIIPLSGFNITNAGLPNPSFQTHTWVAATGTTLGAGYANTPVISYSIENLLFAFTSPRDEDLLRTAFIEKSLVLVKMNVAAIPEPEVWAMLLIGVGMVGFQLRRKMRQSDIRRLV